ncbi:MAG: lipoyl(octanoyl) transferase LipB [Spirochaetales bacterium]|nr:lipoyl(octanoyl) transferase LipB [Spirochaetales bacterium]
MEKKLNIIYAGRMSYEDGLELQLKTQKERMEGKIDDTLILLEHNPVITTGRRDQSHNIFVDPEKVGAEFVKTTRGGEVTYHGPGQIVGYIFINIRDYRKGIKSFVNDLEEVFITLLREEFGIEAGRDDKHRGAWVGDSKITAIGLAVNRDITMHGFAFNVKPDLSHFQWIVPCGIQDKGVTSLEKLLGREPDLEEVQQLVIRHFKKIFNYQ